MTDASGPRRLPLVIAACVLVVAAIAVGLGVWLSRGGAPAAEPAPTWTPVPSRIATPTTEPTPTGPPADTTVYDLAGLPSADVFSLLPALPVDDDPAGAPTGLLATPVQPMVPVFAAPGTPPVATLPADLRWGGSTVPVVAQDGDWVKVLLAGRQGTPPEGNPAQLTGWLRAADVALSGIDSHVEVNLAARTVAIVGPGGAEVLATDLGWGTDATPTPRGRTFIMHAEVMPYGYTRGHPLIYLGVQSPTLAGFDGSSTAVTAFHYHDARSGPISNGCLRLDGAAVDRLAQLPVGTPVYIVG
ncbi:L,D-transpeptidase [Microbacterium sp. GXF7504]